MNKPARKPRPSTRIRLAQPVRINNSTYTPHGYNGAELSPYTGRPGSMDAYALPSRWGNTLHYRDGTTLPL